MSELFPNLLQIFREQLQDRLAKPGCLDDKEIERAGVKVGRFRIVGTIMETGPSWARKNSTKWVDQFSTSESE